MRIWILKSNFDRYNELYPATKLDLDTILSFDGRSKADNWVPIEMKKEYIKKNLILPNYIPSELPIIDFEGKIVLQSLIGKNAEFLPLSYDERKCYILNVTNVIDCFDYSKGKFTPRDNGRVHFVKEYAFREEEIVDTDIFKLIDFPMTTIFVTDKFRNKVIENNLTGFCFELVWDSGKKVERPKSTYGDNIVEGEHHAIEMFSSKALYDNDKLLDIVINVLRNFTSAHSEDDFYELAFVCYMQYDKPTMFLCLNTFDNPATSPGVYKYFGVAEITLSAYEAAEDTIEKLRISVADMIKKFKKKYITPKFTDFNDFIIEFSDCDEDLGYLID